MPFVAVNEPPLPAGEYQMEIVESDYAANSKGTGMLLKLKAQIVGGEYDQRPYFINMSLEHENAQAQEIGQRDFAGLRRATGVLNPNDTVELHRRVFSVKIGVHQSSTTGGLKNAILQYVFPPLAA